ncbi:L-rhamnose 1-epimerase [Anaerohalosphaera lusitana]|uniref:L-rhamnose 1-epimerase n=1 Tax=Anaerohalosphaera lusitana TaxID=1936003 RepID=A0A1U9NQD0_9BACT|nr:L-rhamnose mutarotase [Anaerohalosphaera lusitana]AQT70025.1 L-rhamnose 1-epimerase [Anaerohalosphaera lusitana]
MRNYILCLTVFSLAVFAGCAQKVQRYGSVIGVKEDKLDKYKELHANPWPEVNSKLKDVNIQNYSIYLTQFPDGKYYLFSYFEYTGDDFEADMAKMAADPTTQKWWEETDPCQLPLANRPEGTWWKNMQEVYHLD